MEKVISGFRVLEDNELLQVAGGDPPGWGGVDGSGGGGTGGVTLTPTTGGVTLTATTPLGSGTTLSGELSYFFPPIDNFDLGVSLHTDDGFTIDFHENWDTSTESATFSYDDGHGHVVHVTIWHSDQNGSEGLGVTIGSEF